MAYPRQFKDSKDHEWIDVKGDVATVGITDYAQHELGDVVFVELPKVGAKVATGKTFGSVESVKAGSENYAPGSGEWTEAECGVRQKPGGSKTGPHTGGWARKIQVGELGASGEAIGTSAVVEARP